jgi:hypothetical protein
MKNSTANFRIWQIFTGTRKKTALFLLFATVASIASNNEASSDSKKHKAHVTAEQTKTEKDLNMAMRKLWEDHVTYTRNYIISALAGLEDKDAIAERLLKNQDDIGNAVKPYYGEDAGKKLSSLLRDHILIAVDVVTAAKAGDKDALDKNQKKWTENADEIAVFLSDANPNWNKDDLTKALHKHLELTTGEVTSRLNKDWKGDINSYDKGHEHMLMVADILSEGIRKQFPDKFNK